MTDTPTVERINQLLAEVYTEKGIEIWWSSKNRNLGFSYPNALFASCDDASRRRVLREAERLAGGAW